MINNDGADVGKIVFVNRFYWPDNSATSQILTDLAENLTGRGEDVTIVTSRLSYHDVRVRLEPYERKGQVSIHRVWSTKFDRASLIGRAIDFLTFYISASIKLLFLLRRGDTIITKTDPPLIGIFSWIIGRSKGAFVINWCQDLFPEIARALRIRWSSGPVGAILHRLRNHTLQKADMNVVVSNSMKDALVTQGIHRELITVIRNWPDKDIVPIPRDNNPMRQGLNPGNDFVIAYSGNLGRAHLVKEVYELVRVLAGVPGLKMVFIGGGSGMVELKRLCLEEDFAHVVFFSHQPRAKLSETLSLPDVHLLSLDFNCQKYLAPSKYYGILAAGRPVVFLGSPSSEIAYEVEQGQFGVVLDVKRCDLWEGCIQSLKGASVRLDEMGRNARMAYENRFAHQFSLDQWYQVIEQKRTLAEVSRKSQTA